MTHTEFRKIQAKLGVTNVKLAKLLGGYHELTIARWRNARRKIPLSVAQLMLQFARTHAD